MLKRATGGKRLTIRLKAEPIFAPESPSAISHVADKISHIAADIVKIKDLTQSR